VIVPVGGGGLIAGVATVLKELQPGVNRDKSDCHVRKTATDYG
jgi:threonine dehydratase